MPMFSQNYYDQQWKKVEENYRKGTYKSNLPLIQEIQKKALDENNAVQIIKSLKAEFSIINQTEDDTQNDTTSKTFAKLKNIEAKLKGNDQLLYKVLLNNFISEYYQNNLWEINQRTNINSGDVAQIETWSKLDFKNYLQNNYLDFEKQKTNLKTVKLESYKAVFEETKDIAYFPTLFEWNSYNYINFLNDNSFFTPNELKENNTKIVSIYNEVIDGVSGNSKLYFLYSKINHNCQFSKCKNPIEQLEQLVNNESVKGDYKVFIIAEIMNHYIGKKEPLKALDWAKKAKEMYPNSSFKNNISNLENTITTPSLNIFFETQTQANKPIHIVAEGKNIAQFTLNIYEVKDNFQTFMKFAQDNQKNSFTQVKKTLVRKDDIKVNKLNDYQTTKTSVELKSLPAGIYVAEYIVEGNNRSYLYMLVSDSQIIYQNKKDSDSKNNLLKLVNNENGKQLGNQNIEIIEYADGEPIITTALKTASDGTFRFQDSKKRNYYRYYLVKGAGNIYNMMSVYGNNYYNSNVSAEKNRGISQIFLDRKIYRPGQIVYFKVISTQLNVADKKEKVAENIPLTIKLRNANGEDVSSQNLTTNEFGSVNGNFVLPKGVLNGSFSIIVDGKSADINYNQTTYFNVEEYKRPKFEVTFEPIKGEYKYGQAVEIKGKATTFSGIALSNTDVNYDIKKQNIRWRYFSWYPRTYDDNENSILGSVKTDDKGEFTIKLDLEKDPNLEGIQIDNYLIEANVTDINGETQVATTNVNVASVSHYISAESVNQAFANETLKLNVETKNYNGQNLQKSYNAKLSKLIEPKRVIRDNFRSQIQDKPIFNKEEFIQKFPHDLYDKNDVVENWKTEKVIFERTENQESGTKSSTSEKNLESRVLNLGSLNAGTYKLELYNIEGKDSIKTVQYFNIWDKKNLKDQFPFLKVVSSKDEIKRGEKKKFYVYSAVPEALVNVFVQNGNGETQTQTLPLKNGVLEYEITAPTDESVENVNVQFQIVGFNDVQTESLYIPIKDSKASLKVETVTFRDKLQPNQKEKWTVKVTGEEKEKIYAELLANMYDKSLDQFAPNSYSWSKIWQRPQTFSSYGIRSSLSQKYFSAGRKYLEQVYVREPYFSWFDGAIVNRSFLASLQGEAAGLSVDSAMAPSPMAEREKGVEEVVVMGYNKTSTKPRSAVAKMSDDKYTVDAYQETDGDGILDKDDSTNIKIRENLNETAFFYPNLVTDKDGNVSFEFTSPESLTAWKLMFLAHTKDARGAVLEKEVVTQKEFSVTPNYPRFLREGDELTLQTKLSNLTNERLNGSAVLQISDAFTNEDITEKFGLSQITATKGYNFDNSFVVNANGNEVVSWNLKVPKDVSSIIVKVIAKAGNFSDGEQNAIAVLPNRMLITDALPIFVKEGQNKTFVLDALKNSKSTTLTNVANTLELTTNPIWEVLFALPSLKDDNQNSADVQFNKWFADVLASEVFKANPKMKTVFDEYQSKGLLTSNLEKNQELKQLLLEETPWVLESKNEEEQMAKIARLFDANNMRNSINQDWLDVVKLQNPDGGFSWYSGYPSSYYTSLYILKN